MFDKPGEIEQFDLEEYQKEKETRIKEAEKLFRDERRIVAYWNLEANLRGKILVQSAYIETQLAEIIAALDGMSVSTVQDKYYMLGKKIEQFQKLLRDDKRYSDLKRKYSDVIQELYCINNLRTKMAHSSTYRIDAILNKGRLNSIQLFDHKHNRPFILSKSDVAFHLEKGNSLIGLLFEILHVINKHKSLTSDDS